VGKKVVGWQKDMLVYVRETWGERMGSVNESYLYKIKMIGPKQATLVQVDKATGETKWNRGSNWYLMEKEAAIQATRDQEGRGYRQLHAWDWSQLLVPVGEAGWDPATNF
jgi:hypothetical protein